METALRTRIIASAGVGSRVYWGIRPQGAELPAVVLNIVSDAREQHFGGFTGFQAKRVQIDCYGTTYADGPAMREAIIADLAQPATVGGVSFLGGFVNNTMTRGENTPGGYIHRQMIDVTIWHN
jgi:hypothetical protein